MQVGRRAVMRCLAVVLGAVLCAAPLVASAATDEAETLGELKRAGQVGEQIDGYVGVVANGLDPASRELVERINGKRREAYAAIAAKQGVTLEQVAALAGAKLVEATPGGQLVRDSTGSWKRK